MSTHKTCRPRAMQIARQIERECIHVVDADAIEPEIGLANGWTVEVVISDSVVPPKVLDVLARCDAAIDSATPQGDHMQVVVLV